MSSLRLILLILIFYLFFPSIKCIAGEVPNLSIIRDAETESFLSDLADPIFGAAGLKSQDIKVYIVKDKALNAFVTGEQYIFINSGLITSEDKPDILIGVIAHEIGHIAAHHLAQSNEVSNSTKNSLILTYLAGLAAIISAQPDLGYAVIMGGNQAIIKTNLKYSRRQEEIADNLALTYLDRLHYSSRGLLELLQKFSQQEAYFKDLVDEYSLTHPISSKRIANIKTHLLNHPSYPNSATNKSLESRLKRIRAKLRAFLEEPKEILSEYSGDGFLDLYARAIAYFKQGKINDALLIMDGLIKDRPRDGYLLELKGQMEFESGKIEEAIVDYKKALNLLNKHNGLIAISLASAIIYLNSQDQQLINFAINNLLTAYNEEKDNPELFWQLSLAYDQIGKKGEAALALAEFYLHLRRHDQATSYALRAIKLLGKEERTQILRAKDIIKTAEH